MGARDVHERDLDAVRELGDERALGEEAEELLADDVREREDEHAERGHLRREEEEGEGIAAESESSAGRAHALRV